MTHEHLNDEQMILHFYEEPGCGDALSRHLSECAECQSRLAELQRLLNSVDTIQAPARGEDYGSQVWSRIEGRLRGGPGVRPVRSRAWKVWGAIAAMLLVGAAGYLMGRRAPQRVEIADAGSQVLLVALTEHLERSRMVMTELSNASGDIQYEREEASDLVESNRLYRQSALRQGDTQTVVLLEDLERLLLEIAHSPATMGAAELDEFHRRIEEQSFRVKVLSGRLGRRQNETRGDKL